MIMKKFAVVGLSVLAMAVSAFLVQGVNADHHGDKVLTGEPVDIKCYLGGKSGEGHASCAATCAKGGLPVGFVTGKGDDKVLYLVIGGGGKSASDHLAAHMGKTVKATGKVSNQNGLKVLTVSSVEG
jgi:hypothetical protein